MVRIHFSQDYLFLPLSSVSIHRSFHTPCPAGNIVKRLCCWLIIVACSLQFHRGQVTNRAMEIKKTAGGMKTPPAVAPESTDRLIEV